MDLTVRNLEILRIALRWYRSNLENARLLIQEGLLYSGYSHAPMTGRDDVDKLIYEINSLYNDVCAILARRKDPDEAC